jgi:hypothetical protein
MEKDASEKSDTIELTYENHLTLSKPMQKLKQPVLKAACKKYKLKISGTKPLLIERLTALFNKIKKVITIQSIIRQKQSQNYILGRGPAIKNRDLCNNNTDFITLEPLDEIEYDYFYSYKDSKDFIYGFNICSLITLIKNKKNIVNPYNRNAISIEQQRDIIKLYNNTYILSANFRKSNNFFSANRTPAHNVFVNRHRAPMQISTAENYNPTFYRNIVITEELRERMEILIANRSRPYQERVDNVFMEIDSLGNYTNVAWFTTLTHLQYVRLYRCLFDIWMYRAQLSYDTKRQISPFHDIFNGIFPRHIYHNNITSDQIKLGCLIVIENLVYSSTDIEYRKIGALHALTSFTMVNPNARIAMPWLYESIA